MSRQGLFITEQEFLDLEEKGTGESRLVFQDTGK
jgi:hypothetical protein